MAKYSLEPQKVPNVKTSNRIIKTRIPVPESLPIFEQLEKSEPVSMLGQPPIIWDSAEGVHVFDKWGNKWLDWSACVLVANAGHGHPKIQNALRDVIDQNLLSTYAFVHERRAKLCKQLTDLSPDPNNYKTFLLSTGSEATENAIKLAKTYGIQKHGREKNIIVSFEHAFHGRTLGAQLAGGIPGLKNWIVNNDPSFIQVPFPDGYRNTETDFEHFLKALEEQKIKPEQIAGIMSESYQGVGPHFFPQEYARKLGLFCKEHDIVLVMDEVQSGFGRTGKMFCYEHYDLTPDIITCGKGISSSLPLAAVIGRSDIMGLYQPGTMTSTHSASPLPVAAAIANIEIIEEENLVENAASLDEQLRNGLTAIANKHPDVLGHVFSVGLVSGIQVVQPGTKNPYPELAHKINEKCVHKGLLMFAPVGIGGACIKIAPPLCITKEQIAEGLEVLEEACDEVISANILRETAHV